MFEKALSKDNDELILVLSKSRVRFVFSERKMFSYCQNTIIDVTNDVFPRYDCEAKSNAIVMGLSLSNFLNVLRNGDGADSVNMKLTNKQFRPVIEITCKRADAASNTTHDVPVDMSVRGGPRHFFEEPVIYEAFAEVHLAHPSKLLAVIERMKSFSRHIMLEANMGQQWRAHRLKVLDGDSAVDSSAAHGFQSPAARADGRLSVSVLGDVTEMSTYFNKLTVNLDTACHTHGKTIALEQVRQDLESARMGKCRVTVAAKDLLVGLRSCVAYGGTATWTLMMHPRTIVLHGVPDDNSGAITMILATIGDDELDDDEEGDASHDDACGGTAGAGGESMAVDG